MTTAERWTGRPSWPSRPFTRAPRRAGPERETSLSGLPVMGADTTIIAIVTDTLTRFIRFQSAQHLKGKKYRGTPSSALVQLPRPTHLEPAKIGKFSLLIYGKKLPKAILYVRLAIFARKSTQGPLLRLRLRRQFWP